MTETFLRESSLIQPLGSALYSCIAGNRNPPIAFVRSGTPDSQTRDGWGATRQACPSVRWLLDLFKEIPLSAVLREQLLKARAETARLEKALAECDADRVALAKQLYAARAEIERLRSRRPARAAGDYDPLERF